MHTTTTNISEEVIMSECNNTRGTNHMFERTSQLRQEELRSLNTSSVSLISSSITHFLSSSVPYFFPCFLCLLLKNCQRIFHSLRCSPLIAFSSGNKDTGKKRREVGKKRKVGQSEEGWKDSWESFEC